MDKAIKEHRVKVLTYLLFGLMSPILFAEGWYVRKTTPKLPEPKGEREGVSGSGNALSLLILGDSAAAGVGVANQSQALTGQITRLLSDKVTLTWRLLAQSGYSTQDLLAALKTQNKGQFDVVLISLGVNDVTDFIHVETWLKQLQDLLDFCRQELSSQQVLFSLLPPMGAFPALPQPLAWALGLRSQQFNDQLIKWLNTESDCQFINMGQALDADKMASDGFHPGEEIYRHWAKMAVRKINII
ncbi:SGNH/GDSL hydrolase family protein [Shewanella surugensis]|uniref:SGNH/GDSL hydrolase family protein n=1 Tax=Shewanella surugensis TaxID=212020 RepID=A0ABT0L858_9GAMM|nr:SGNH/GDSL hydrolase family protein [Shewanella surugensis]MCL1123874.1 SGNH/GDSL hydrolase family protein [Shewanella surugensis]